MTRNTLWRVRPFGLCRVATLRASPLCGSVKFAGANFRTGVRIKTWPTAIPKRGPQWGPLFGMAVGQGFEPREGCPSTVFKTAAFDHSASPPKNLFVTCQRHRAKQAELYSYASPVQEAGPPVPEFSPSSSRGLRPGLPAGGDRGGRCSRGATLCHSESRRAPRCR